jgi:hypothetical protein
VDGGLVSGDSGWLTLFLVLAGALAVLAALRWVEQGRIARMFGSGDIVVTSFGVGYFGRESEPGGPLRSTGALVLLRDRLYYRARFGGRELSIPGDRITALEVADSFKRRPLYQQAVIVGFLGPEGLTDRAAFRLPRPAQWIAAIRQTLLPGAGR